MCLRRTLVSDLAAGRRRFTSSPSISPGHDRRFPYACSLSHLDIGARVLAPCCYQPSSLAKLARRRPCFNIHVLLYCSYNALLCVVLAKLGLTSSICAAPVRLSVPSTPTSTSPCWLSDLRLSGACARLTLLSLVVNAQFAGVALCWSFIISASCIYDIIVPCSRHHALAHRVDFPRRLVKKRDPCASLTRCSIEDFNQRSSLLLQISS